MKKQIFLFAITIYAIGCTKDAAFTQNFNRRITDLNAHKGKYKSSYDWRTDSVFKVDYTNTIKYEILYHLTPQGQVVLRLTNLQSCTAPIRVYADSPDGDKLYEPNVPDTVNINVTSTNGDCIIGFSTLIDCNGNLDGYVYLCAFNINDLHPYEEKRKYPF